MVALWSHVGTGSTSERLGLPSEKVSQDSPQAQPTPSLPLRLAPCLHSLEPRIRCAYPAQVLLVALCAGLRPHASALSFSAPHPLLVWPLPHRPSADPRGRTAISQPSGAPKPHQTLPDQPDPLLLLSPTDQELQQLSTPLTSAAARSPAQILEAGAPPHPHPQDPLFPKVTRGDLTWSAVTPGASPLPGLLPLPYPVDLVPSPLPVQPSLAPSPEPIEHSPTFSCIWGSLEAPGPCGPRRHDGRAWTLARSLWTPLSRVRAPEALRCRSRETVGFCPFASTCQMSSSGVKGSF